MRYLRVKNWEKFQQQSTKRLPWIKLFTELLEPTRQPEYSLLSDQSKAVLHHVWLMAAVFGGRIPEDWLTRDRLNIKGRVDLQPLIAANFVWFESEEGLIPSSNRDSIRDFNPVLNLNLSRARIARSENLSSPSLVSSTEERNTFSPDLAFDAIWGEYPRRIGRKQAQRHFVASVTSAADLAAIRKALANYKADVAGREMRFIQHGSTWFNQWADWVEMIPRAAPAIDGLQTPDEQSERDDLREWASARGRSLQAVERGGQWPWDDVTESEFRGYWQWQQTECQGQLETDGRLNDLAAYLTAKKESVA